MTIVSNVIATDPVASLIYESPDNGKTIYARQPGSDKRMLVNDNPDLQYRMQVAMRSNRLLQILKLSETDITIRDALEALESLYILKYGYDQNT